MIPLAGMIKKAGHTTDWTHWKVIRHFRIHTLKVSLFKVYIITVISIQCYPH